MQSKPVQVPEVDRLTSTPIVVIDENFEVYEDSFGLFRIYDNVSQVWERPYISIEACLKRCEMLVATYWFINLP